MSRKGWFVVKRKTQRKRLIRKLKGLRLEMKKRRHDTIRAQCRWLGAVLRGHYAYFGITGNAASITRFHHQTTRWWLWVLRRRGQRPKLPWDRFRAILARFPLPAPRIVHNWRYRVNAVG